MNNAPLINLVVHYYTEDDIEITELPSNVSVKATAGDVSKQPTPKPKQITPQVGKVTAPKSKKKEGKKSNAVQLDLFG